MFSRICTFFGLYLIHFGFVNGLSFKQCSEQDSYFARSRERIEFCPLQSGDSPWRETHERIISKMSCSSMCHLRSWCNSALYHKLNESCLLSEWNRTSPFVTYVKSSDSIYFERHKCDIKELFIAVVSKAIDCADVRSIGFTTNDVYGVKASSGEAGHYQSVLCEMTLLSGGWTVFQQCVDEVVSFK